MSEDAQLSSTPLSQRLGFHLRALMRNLLRQSAPLIVVMLALVALRLALPTAPDVTGPVKSYAGIVIEKRAPVGHLDCLKPKGIGDSVSLAFAESLGKAKFADDGDYKVHERYERVEGKPYPCDPGFDAYRLEKIDPPTTPNQQQ